MNVWRIRRGPFVAEYDTGAVCGYCSYECYFTHRYRNNLEELAGEQSIYFPSSCYCSFIQGRRVGSTEIVT